MASNQKKWQMIAGINGLIGVVMGAVAAHVVADAHAASLAQQASLYQLIHAGVLLWLSNQSTRGFLASRWLFLAGLILFCGTLYLKALTGWTNVTSIAPTGGVCLMVGWIVVAFSTHKIQDDQT